MNYFRRKIKYLYYIIFVKRFDETSLKTKIMNDIIKYLIIFFSSIYLIGFLIGNYMYQINIKEFILWSIPYIFFSLLILFVIDFIFIKTLKKHLFDRLEKVEKEITHIQNNNYSQRLTMSGSDEIAKTIYFTNQLLTKFEKLIEIEKEYSLIDPLTGCYNRRALETNFDLIKKKSKRDKNIFGVVILDLDFFKKINDTYGHKIGDEVLKNFTKITKETIREEDFLYRIGGEEFIILLIDTNKIKTRQILKRLGKNIPYKLKKRIPTIEHDITVSGGFVLSKNYDLKKDKILNKMIGDADKLLYKAKKTGRNRILG